MAHDATLDIVGGFHAKPSLIPSKEIFHYPLSTSPTKDEGSRNAPLIIVDALTAQFNPHLACASDVPAPSQSQDFSPERPVLVERFSWELVIRDELNVMYNNSG